MSDKNKSGGGMDDMMDAMKGDKHDHGHKHDKKHDDKHHDDKHHDDKHHGKHDDGEMAGGPGVGSSPMTGATGTNDDESKDHDFEMEVKEGDEDGGKVLGAAPGVVSPDAAPIAPVGSDALVPDEEGDEDLKGTDHEMGNKDEANFRHK